MGNNENTTKAYQGSHNKPDPNRSAQTISHRTTSHRTEHEDLSKPNEGVVHKMKTDTILEKEKVMRKQTESRNMILTGKYEDLAQLSYEELINYANSQPKNQNISGLDRESLRHAPIVNAGTRVDTSETRSTAISRQPRDYKPQQTTNIDPPKSFATSRTTPCQIAKRKDSDSSSQRVANGSIINDDDPMNSETISSKTRTVETMTFKMEKDGLVETRVEHKITIKSDGDQVDHDRALADAIHDATMMDPKMTVQKIEITQQAPLN